MCNCHQTCVQFALLILARAYQYNDRIQRQKDRVIWEVSGEFKRKYRP